MIEQFQLIENSCGIGWYQNVYLTAWWDDATIERLTTLQEHRKRFLAKQSGPLCSLSLLYQTKLKTIPKEVRKKIEEINLEGDGRFIGEAYYVKIGGLFLSSMRFLLAGVRLVNKTKAPLEVFNDISEASRWISTLNKHNEEELIKASQSFVALCGK